jgi:hypothetical protein
LIEGIVDVSFDGNSLGLDGVGTNDGVDGDILGRTDGRSDGNDMLFADEGAEEGFESDGSFEGTIVYPLVGTSVGE